MSDQDKQISDNDLHVAEEIGGLRADVKNILGSIQEIKKYMTEKDKNSAQCRTGFDVRIKKLEDTEKRVKIYISVAMGIGAVVMFIVDKAFNYFIAMKKHF